MHLDILLIAGSAVVGFLVGLTGMGGGALMTPMLVLVFGVAPSAAISSDLIAALFMKPLGVAVHWRRRNVHARIVTLLCAGSIPAALLGTYTMSLVSRAPSSELTIERLLGVALIIGSVAMVIRSFFITTETTHGDPVSVRPLITVAVGALGGFMVGLTSVGAGTLVMVLLATVYPTLRSDHLVGTDLAQSIPLTVSATVGSLLFGHVDFNLTGSIILGSVPAVIVGAVLSSRLNGVVLRRALTIVVLASGLTYVGTPKGVIASVALLVTLALVGLSFWHRHRHTLQRAEVPLVAESIENILAFLPARLD